MSEDKIRNVRSDKSVSWCETCVEAFSGCQRVNLSGCGDYVPQVGCIDSYLGYDMENSRKSFIFSKQGVNLNESNESKKGSRGSASYIPGKRQQSRQQGSDVPGIGGLPFPDLL